MTPTDEVRQPVVRVNPGDAFVPSAELIRLTRVGQKSAVVNGQ